MKVSYEDYYRRYRTGRGRGGHYPLPGSGRVDLTARERIEVEKEKLAVRQGEKILQIEPGDVYYFEAVDNRVFLYSEKNVYETRMKLYELERRFAGTDFFRVSKSVILNLARVKNFSPGFNGRFEALMQNGERVGISRQYVPFLKSKLGL